jgi:cytochrome c biogenesis protein CcdA/thiol-disulfide isomerase/thioredoxin
MILAILAFLGGVLTILSPCILPVLPFVFARSGQPFARSTLPLLIGMALTFAALATLAAFGGAWVVRFNDYGRVLALVVLAVSALALLSSRVADWLTRPVVALGGRLAADAPGRSGVAASLVLGVATGFLWAPCAGPILGLILTGAALHGPSAATSGLLLAYALGAALSLGVAATAGKRVLALLRGSLPAGEWLRRALGIAILTGVAAIALGWDTGILTRLSVGGTNRYEQALLERLGGGRSNGGAMAMTGAMTGPAGDAMSGNSMMMTGSHASGSPPVEGQLPSLAGAAGWINSTPLTAESLRGKVVLIDFWTYSCINCLRALPYVKSWYARYASDGLVVIGVHAPEFAFEKDPDNVRRAVHDLGITYPVALDNGYVIWNAFHNEYWPAHYFIDAQGRIRGHHFGEGDYEESEALLRQLLAEAGAAHLAASAATWVAPSEAAGVEAPPDKAQLDSPETYLGYARAANFRSSEPVADDVTRSYSAPARLSLNEWALVGPWRIERERAVGAAAHTTIQFRFHARDLHLVLGAPDPRHAVRFRVALDGHPPGGDHGSDVHEDGSGAVRDVRLYQLIRQGDPQGEHTFTIEFLDAGVQAYSFTFG